MCGATCESVAIHREQAPTMLIHLLPGDENGRYNLVKCSNINVKGMFYIIYA
jgi:hypothetical protein